MLSLFVQSMTVKHFLPSFSPPPDAQMKAGTIQPPQRIFPISPPVSIGHSSLHITLEYQLLELLPQFIGMTLLHRREVYQDPACMEVSAG